MNRARHVRTTGSRAIAVAVALVFLLPAGSCMTTRVEHTSSPLVVAHRGGAGLAPENTLAAFTEGLTHQPDALELDVHMSRDGHLVVIHDPTLMRTANVSGAVEEYDLAELRTMNAAARHFGKSFGRQPIPTLDEVLQLASGHAGVQVEIKLRADGTRYPGMESAVVEALRSAGMTDQAVVISFDFPTLQSVQELEPTLHTGALIGTRYMESEGTAGPAAIAARIHALGVSHAGVDRRWLTPELLASFHELGLLVGVWTVNDAREMRRFVDMGVDFVTSDRPDIARDVVGR